METYKEFVTRVRFPELQGVKVKKKNKTHWYTIVWSLDGIGVWSYIEARNKQSAVRELKSRLKVKSIERCGRKL